MTNEELILKAAERINSRKVYNNLIGDVGSALITEKGNIYFGVCADFGSNSFCAEKAAIANMLTYNESRILKIVAVWKNENNVLHVIAPCGTCRQLIYDVNNDNLETDVIIDNSTILKLKELLPYHKSYIKC